MIVTRINDKEMEYDSVLQLLFSNEDTIIQLCKCIDGGEYSSEDLREAFTTENMLFVVIRNRGYFFYLRQDMIVNQNVPLISFMEFADVLAFYDKVGINYSQIVLPRCISFYLGEEIVPAQMKFKLSDSFLTKQDDNPCECIVTMFNLGNTDNSRMLDLCKPLKEYKEFIACIRKEYLSGKTIQMAVDNAIEKCLVSGILKDFLTENNEEVRKSILWHQESGINCICNAKEGEIEH